MPDYTLVMPDGTRRKLTSPRPLSDSELKAFGRKAVAALGLSQKAKPQQEYQDRPASKGPIPMASPGWNPPALDEREALGDPTNVMARARSKNPALAQQVFKSSYQSKEPEVEGAINAVKKALTSRPKPKAKKSDFKPLTDEKGNRIVGDYDVDTLKRAAADMVERVTTGFGNLLDNIQAQTIGPTPMGYRQGPGRRVGEVAGSMLAVGPDAIFDALIATSPNASIADRIGGATNVAGKLYPSKALEGLGVMSQPVMAELAAMLKKNPKLTLAEAERILGKSRSQYEAPVKPKADIPQPGVNMKVGEPTSVPTGRRTRKPGDTTPEAGGKMEAERAPSDFSDLMIEGYPVGELEKELAHRMYKLAPQPNKLEEVIKEYSRRKWRGNPNAKEIAGRAKQMLAEWKSKHPTPEAQKKLDDDAMAAWQAELERQQALKASTSPAEAPVPATPTVEPSVTPAAQQRANVERQALRGVSYNPEKNHLGELLGSDAPLYHETDLKGASGLLQRMEAGPRSHATGVSVSPNRDLALGQGGRGYTLEIDPTKVNGHIPNTPANAAIKGTSGGTYEAKFDASIRGAVRAIHVPSKAGMAAVRKIKGIEKVFDFDAAEASGKGFRIPRRAPGAKNAVQDETQVQAITQEGNAPTVSAQGPEAPAPKDQAGLLTDASTNPTGRTDAHNDFYLPDKLAQREPMKMKGKGVIFDSAYDEAALGLQHKDPKVSLAYERAIKGAGLDVNEARTHGAEIARKLKSGEVAPSDYGYRVTEQPLPQRGATSQASRGPVSQEPIAQQPAVTPAAPEPPAAVPQKPPVSQTGKPVETGKPRIISDESYAQARKALLEGGAMMGIEPKKIKAIATIGAYHLENGVRNFKAWSDKMIEEVGEWIRPHLNEAWKASKRAAGEPTTDDLPTNWDHVPVYGGPRVQQPDLAGDFPAGRLADGPGYTEPTPGTPTPTVGENQIKPVQADPFGPEGQELTARKNVPVSTDPLPDLPGTYGGGRVIQGDLEGNFPAGRLADKPGYTPPKPGGEGATTSVEHGKKQYSFYFDPNGLKNDKNGLAAIKFPELQKERVRAIRNAIKSIRLLNPVSFINDTTANLANAPVELAVKNTAALLDKAMWGSLRKTQGAASGFITPAMVARSQQGVVKRVAKEVVENFRTGNATDLAKWGVHRTESGKIEAIARARGSSDLWARDLWHRLTREEMKRANPHLTDPQIESIALEEELKSVFANESWGSKLVSSLEGKLDTEELQALGIVFDQIVPFPKILANVSGRVTDFTPLGFVKAMGKYYQGRKSGFTLADRRNINELVSRGLIGTAGLYIGMKRYQAGNLHPDEINPQTGQTFWPNLMESGLGPWGKVMTLGAQFGIALDPRMNFTESERKRLLTGTIMDAFDQPAAGAVTKVSSIMSPVTGADSIGGLAGKLATSPVAPLRNFATAKDWADVRKMFIGIQPRDEKRPKGFVETVKGAFPGLRSQLPDRGMPHPELGKYAVVYKPAVAKKIDGVTVEKPEQLAKREAVRRDMLKRFIDQVSSSPNYKALGVKEKRALLQAITHNILTESFLKADADRRTEIIQKSLERALRPKQ